MLIIVVLLEELAKLELLKVYKKIKKQNKTKQLQNLVILKLKNNNFTNIKDLFQ